MRVAPQFERLSGTSVVKISLIRFNFKKRKMEEYVWQLFILNFCMKNA